MNTSTDSLTKGHSGDRVLELRQLLARQGHSVADTAGHFGEATEAAVRSFQTSRRLEVNGIVDSTTWSELLESSLRLGDRTLYLRNPLIKGDDVAELQGRLNSLGFYAGREDGVLGQNTARAVSEFQLNSGMAQDGICGRAMVDTLDRIGRMAAGNLGALRDQQNLFGPEPKLNEKRVFISSGPELAALGELVAKAMADLGPFVVFDSAGNSDALVAQDANEFESDYLIALKLRFHVEPGTYFYQSPRYTSQRGETLAKTMADQVGKALGHPFATAGKTSPLLRDTQMTAIVCEFGANPNLFEMGWAVAQGLASALDSLLS